MAETKHYLLIYDRQDGEIVYLRRFEHGHVALSHRFTLERAFRAPRFEVVVLSAGSLAEIRKTHGRYFYTLPELAARASELGQRAVSGCERKRAEG